MHTEDLGQELSRGLSHRESLIMVLIRAGHDHNADRVHRSASRPNRHVHAEDDRGTTRAVRERVTALARLTLRETDGLPEQNGTVVGTGRTRTRGGRTDVLPDDADVLTRLRGLDVRVRLAVRVQDLSRQAATLRDVQTVRLGPGTDLLGIERTSLDGDRLGLLGLDSTLLRSRRVLEHHAHGLHLCDLVQSLLRETATAVSLRETEGSSVSATSGHFVAFRLVCYQLTGSRRAGQE
jgi:hypothetical protein